MPIAHTFSNAIILTLGRLPDSMGANVGKTKDKHQINDQIVWQSAASGYPGAGDRRSWQLT
jgi:hypothetical protein